MKRKIKFIMYAIVSFAFLFMIIPYLTTETNNIVISTVGSVRMTQEVDDPSLLRVCQDWRLSEKDIKEIVQTSYEISSFERNEHYYHMPCEIDGMMMKDGLPFSYQVNAGATFSLTSEEGTYTYYGCPQESCVQYFLMMPDIPPASGK